MPTRSAGDAAEPDALAHLTLRLGRILLLNGAETEQVHVSATRFARAFGAEANLLVSCAAVLVTLSAGERLRTTTGYRVPGMGVGMSAIEAVNRLVDAAAAGPGLLKAGVSSGA